MGDDIKYEDVFIWTEIYNCGKIGKVAIDSFFKFHPNLILNVYGFKDDFKAINSHSNLRVHIFPNKNSLRIKFEFFFRSYFGLVPILSSNELKYNFKKGHIGTALLWTYLIKKRQEKYLLHFDSDNIFLGDVVNQIISSKNDFDLVGPIRCYKHNPFRDKIYEKLNDVVSTNCFLFNKTLISETSFKRLINMCTGAFNPLGHKVIDFFDPISFQILDNGGKIKFLNFNEVGATDHLGSRQNDFAFVNDFNTPFKIDFGSKLIHFSAVGSGMNIYLNNTTSIPQSYQKYALDRYALYCKIFYNEDMGFDLSSYNSLIDYFRKNLIGLN